MKIGIVAPSPIPFTAGGAEKLWWGLQQEINQHTEHQAELIKLPSPERTFWEVIDSYERFWRLDLSHFDLVISGKYPAWMTRHSNHLCYMLHRLRGFYDCFHFLNLPPRYQTTNETLLKLQSLLTSSASPAAVERVFDHLRDLRTRSDLPEDAFHFPGSLVREIVQFFDNAALQQNAIRRYAAISRNVANREDYFPPGVVANVIYPPSNLKNFRCERFDYILTASRLDGPKRINLAIEAMKFVKSDIQLRICGEGPEEARLKQLADGDSRIQFLGYRSAADLVEEYANALAVVFTPYDEDYGFITLEAMMSGKPVITTTDAGGPNEFVINGQTGFSIAPEASAIAERIDWLALHRNEAAGLGDLARKRVQSITWSGTVKDLLKVRPRSLRVVQREPCRKLTVATTFPIAPVRGGGQARIFNLYKNLFPSFKTELITFAGEGEPAFEADIAPGMREIRIPKTPAHARAETEISGEVEWFPVTDVVFPRLVELTPAYIEALERSCRGADIVVASHPYVLSAITSVTGKPLWYEAQDVEYVLKRDVLPKTPRGVELIEGVQRVERRCCELAEMVMACSEDDRATLQSLYDLPAARMRVVPNGVDTREVRFTPRAQRLETKQELGLANCFTAVFVGSWHEPNLRAIKAILKMAEFCPQVRFLIVGSSCLAFEKQITPDNVAFLGVVDEVTKNLVLRMVDVALNPMQQGSGTNLKMLEYAAAGIPIVTTAMGMRGLGFHNVTHVFVEEISRFQDRIESIRKASGTALQEMTEQARQHVRKYFDWRRISHKLLASL